MNTVTTCSASRVTPTASALKDCGRVRSIQINILIHSRQYTLDDYIYDTTICYIAQYTNPRNFKYLDSRLLTSAFCLDILLVLTLEHGFISKFRFFIRGCLPQKELLVINLLFQDLLHIATWLSHRNHIVSGKRQHFGYT